MYKWTTILLVLAVQAASPLCAQEKFERESRIRETEVPAVALAFMEPVEVRRIKWYREEGIERNSYEAKYKRDGARYSVEFDSLGRVEDIEVEVDAGGLAPALRQAIATQLESDCASHKLQKVQRQYTGSEAELAAVLRDTTKTQGTIRYEVMVRCTGGGAVDLFEYLFDREGGMLRRAKVVFRNSSHLEY